MKKTWNAITAMLLAALLVLPLVPTAAATEPKSTVDVENDTGTVTLTLEAKSSGAKVQGAEITLYRVGEGTIVNSNLVFELVDALQPAAPAEGEEAETPVELNGLKADENIKAAAVLKQKIEALQKELTEGQKLGIDSWTKITDENGVAVYGVPESEGAETANQASGLPVGVYLVVQTARHSSYYDITPFLLYLPYTETDKENSSGMWVFDVAANPKVERRPSGGGGGGKDPEEIVDPEVPLDPGTTPEIPGEEIPDPEVPTTALPQTGLLRWPVPVLALAGLALIAAGLLSERKSRARGR